MGTHHNVHGSREDRRYAVPAWCHGFAALDVQVVSDSPQPFTISRFQRHGVESGFRSSLDGATPRAFFASIWSTGRIKAFILFSEAFEKVIRAFGLYPLANPVVDARHAVENGATCIGAVRELYMRESMNSNNARFYIDGAWVSPAVPKSFDLVNPATEEPIGAISLGSAQDVAGAGAAARKAISTYSQTSKKQRLTFLRQIIASYKARFDDIAAAITEEMGSPLWFSKKVQAQTALDQFEEVCRVLEPYEFEYRRGGTRSVREPIGVCGLITPWNWP